MPKDASPWLIAERARCRAEGLRYAKQQIEALGVREALEAIDARIAYYEGVMADPKPTGIPGE
jgi:hypothetical protein